MGIFDFVKPFVEPVLNLAGDIFGIERSNQSAGRIASDNVNLQREFAQQGIRWRVEDAKAAGIHPLAALGANTLSFSPINVGKQEPNWAAHGQNIGRAINAVTSKEERVLFAQGLEKNNLELQKAGLENAILTEELRRLKDSKPVTANEYGIPGQGTTIEEYNLGPDVVMEKNQVPFSSAPGIQSGIVPSYQFGWIGKDEAALYPSKPLEEKLDADSFTALRHAFRQGGQYLKRQLFYLLPASSRKKLYSDIRNEIAALPPPGKGKKWVYNQRSSTYFRVDEKHNGRNSVWYYKVWR